MKCILSIILIIFLLLLQEQTLGNPDEGDLKEISEVSGKVNSDAQRKYERCISRCRDKLNENRSNQDKDRKAIGGGISNTSKGEQSGKNKCYADYENGFKEGFRTGYEMSMKELSLQDRQKGSDVNHDTGNTNIQTISETDIGSDISASETRKVSIEVGKRKEGSVVEGYGKAIYEEGVGTGSVRPDNTPSRHATTEMHRNGSRAVSTNRAATAYAARTAGGTGTATLNGRGTVNFTTGNKTNYQESRLNDRINRGRDRTNYGYYTPNVQTNSRGTNRNAVFNEEVASKSGKDIVIGSAASRNGAGPAYATGISVKQGSATGYGMGTVNDNLGADTGYRSISNAEDTSHSTGYKKPHDNVGSDIDISYNRDSPRSTEIVPESNRRTGIDETEYAPKKPSFDISGISAIGHGRGVDVSDRTDGIYAKGIGIGKGHFDEDLGKVNSRAIGYGIASGKGIVFGEASDSANNKGLSYDSSRKQQGHGGMGIGEGYGFASGTGIVIGQGYGGGSKSGGAGYARGISVDDGTVVGYGKASAWGN